MAEAHIVPGLEHSSLISTKKFCEAEYNVVFHEQECRVYYKNELVLCGRRDKKIEIWQLPINLLKGLDLPNTFPCRGTITQPRNNTRFALNVANNLYTLPYKHQ